MNRLEMARHIEEKVPFLAKHNEFQWKEAERMRRQFAADYPVGKIDRLGIDQYVIGKSKTNRSFCYRLERELDSLGRILGATAYKFGVYYGKTKTDATMKYRFAQHWGRNKDAAFTAVKQSIVSLLLAASQDDMASIRENRISPMFKGKLLFIYYPDRFAPIYAKPHLEHFLANLNIIGTFESEADMQKALMRYRNTWPALKAQHPSLYMRFLYDLFSYPQYAASTGTGSTVQAPLLSEAIKGAAFLSEMPPVSDLGTGGSGTDSGSIDYAEQQKQLKRIGDRGEALVLAMERFRLTEVNRRDLAQKVTYIAERNDNAGFDILSFDENGSERPIEVKATRGKSLERGFYITANEIEAALKLPNYHIYFVFRAMSKHPRVLPMKKPMLGGSDFDLNATVFHATLKAPGGQPDQEG